MVTLCVLGGFYFGNVTFVKEHFSLVALGIVLISLLPMVIAAVKTRTAKVADR